MCEKNMRLEGYLQKPEEIGVLESRKAGREKIFLHPALLKLLAEP
jgi:hypothetical protein